MDSLLSMDPLVDPLVLITFFVLACNSTLSFVSVTAHTIGAEENNSRLHPLCYRYRVGETPGPITSEAPPMA